MRLRERPMMRTHRIPVGIEQHRRVGRIFDTFIVRTRICSSCTQTSCACREPEPSYFTCAHRTPLLCFVSLRFGVFALARCFFCFWCIRNRGRGRALIYDFNMIACVSGARRPYQIWSAWLLLLQALQDRMLSNYQSACAIRTVLCGKRNKFGYKY